MQNSFWNNLIFSHKAKTNKLLNWYPVLPVLVRFVSPGQSFLQVYEARGTGGTGRSLLPRGGETGPPNPV